MKRFFLLLMTVVFVGCSNDLNQESAEKWVVQVIENNPSNIEKETSTGYGGKIFHSEFSVSDIEIIEVGKVEIIDENTRRIYARLSYINKSSYIENNYHYTDNYTDNVTFVFKKSTDNEWYLSQLNGSSKGREPKYNALFWWRGKIFSEYSKIPIK